MIRVRGKAAWYGEVWFDGMPPRRAGVDILVLRCRRAPFPGVRCVPGFTLVSDLAPDPDSLLAVFTPDCRYKVRRAGSRDGLHDSFFGTPRDRLESFADFYDRFAHQKGLPPCDRAWLAAACRAGRLALTAASDGAGEALVWHAYVHTARVARLQYSASCFRDKDTLQRSLIGRANRWLHWRDMLAFRARGVREYDWGGVFPDDATPERAGINAFKRSFGGRRETRYDCTVPLTLKGRLYLPLRDLWRGWTEAQPAAA